MQQFQARGSLFCLCEELDPLTPKVRARCGAALFSAVMNSWKAVVMEVGEVEVGEASSSVSSSAIAGYSLEYSVLRLDFVSMLSI